jgi:hypothetical protein
MSRPGRFKNTIAKKAGKAIKPGARAEVDWDKAHGNEFYQGAHRPDDQASTDAYLLARDQLAGAIQREDLRGEIEARKALNWSIELKLAIRSSWCPRCINYLHNCQCEVYDERTGASVEFVDGLMERTFGEETRRREQEKLAEKMARRKAYIARKRGHVK